MNHFRTPHDVISALLVRSPYRSMARAMTEGKVEFLGGFSEVPPEARPGWIVRITSVYKRMWIMGVVPEEELHTISIKRLTDIPWEYWVGPTGNRLYDGDDPNEAERLKNLCSDQTLERDEPTVT
jgi:hypothetical protein